MPVSKKRKKDGKAVHRQPETAVEGEAHPHAPDLPSTPLQRRMGKPTNPFIAGQRSTRGAQRGR